MKAERRFASISNIRAEGGDAKKIVGYAAVFNSMSVDLGGFREVIKPGAFARSLAANPDVRALIDHDSSMILGRTKAGTLRLSEDSTGLLAEIDPPDTSTGRDVVESLTRGDLDQMSFGFYVMKDSWRTEGGEQIRELEEVDLFDVSVVTFPAYEATRVQMRSAAEVFAERQQELKPPVSHDHELANVELAKRV